MAPWVAKAMILTKCGELLLLRPIKWRPKNCSAIKRYIHLPGFVSSVVACKIVSACNNPGYQGTLVPLAVLYKEDDQELDKVAREVIINSLELVKEQVAIKQWQQAS